MSEVINPEVITEEVVTEAVEEAPVKKERKPREKVRDIEEIRDLPLKKLSDKEKELLINTLKEENMLYSKQAAEYKHVAESAFEQQRQFENRYDAMEKFYRGKLAYVDMQLNAFHTAINEAIKGGIE